MSSPLLLRAFVNERLTAAADEIFHCFERTILKYEDEASSSKQEIERLRGVLLEFASNTNHNTVSSQALLCKDESSPEHHLCEQEPGPSVSQEEPELRHIKEEEDELWADQQQQEEEEQDVEFGDVDASYLPHSSVCEQHEDEDTESQTENSDYEEQFKGQTENVHVMLHLPQFTETLVQNDGVQDVRDNGIPVASFTSNQTYTEQTSSIASRETTELNQYLPCFLCDRSFTSNYHLTNHAFRIHTRITDVICAVCGQTMESNQSLNLHLRSHKSSRCCQVCGKQCNSITVMSEHMASHAGVKLHRCQICGKECSRKGDLKIHMRIHTGEKPFCCSHCDKSFTHSGHLKKHMRSHTGERPHRCELCGRGFLQSAHLKYHMGTHTQKY
ncbi:zinc finger protein 33B-like [Notothenia coriiceps]|uniref:Zinc finger protein 33B-like n=1 Tax=Notothenia coriiceps TaxID=8208 RepID=A0A6I9MS96_9TELE|nr:PREDICTED: zinc finger protein 33B-like [Notothenia coriiceps]